MILAALLLQAMDTQTAVEAEYDFAADAQALGQWTAFAKWAAEDGVLVGRNVVNAREWAATLDDPEQALRWWPVRSYVSCKGNTAVNIGGWVDPQSGKGGQFHTVWQREPEGWRYRVDIGSIGPDPLPDTGSVEVIRAACDPDELMFSIRHDSPASGVGSSDDQSLSWAWTLREDGSKRLSWSYWDGTDFRSFNIEMVAPEPSE